MADNVVVRQPDEGDAIWMLGGMYEVKAAGEETSGSVTVMEMRIPPGAAPPPHTHPGGEAVYVIDGNVNYHIDGKVHTGGPGSFFYIPADTEENFEPAGDSPLHILVIYTPGGIDRFFHEAGETAQTRDIPPPPEAPPDLERIVAIGRQYGMDIKAPAGA